MAASNKEPEIPYHDGEARGILGAIISGDVPFSAFAKMLRAGEFYWPSHRVVWEAVGAIIAEGGTPDEFTVVAWLQRHGRLAEAGGDLNIYSLTTHVPDRRLHAAQSWAKTLLQDSEARTLYDLARSCALASQRPLDAKARADIVRFTAQLEGIQRRLRGEDDVNSLNSSFVRSSRPLPPPLRAEAYHGLAGDIVRAYESHTEADPRGVLVQFLTLFGLIVGRQVCFKVGSGRHYPNLFLVLVGATASGRKGVAWEVARYIFTLIPTWGDWLKVHVVGGISSGEGIIHAVRDYKESEGPDGRKKEPEPLQTDKKMLLRESEFSLVLKMATREGNTSSEVQRRAWDGDALQTLNKNSPERATDAHIAIIGNITATELARLLTSTDIANGLANRYLWIHVERARLLPDGDDFDDVDSQPLAERLQAAIEYAKGLQEGHVMTRDSRASVLWRQHYERLTTSGDGLFDAMTARGAPQVMRLAMIYALLDCEQVIREPHLQAALAVWDYAEESVRYLFGDALGDPIADTILTKLRMTPEGLTRTEISGLLGRNAKSADIERALSLLHERHLACFEKADPEKGRPTERWFSESASTDTKLRTTKETKKPSQTSDEDIISFNSYFVRSSDSQQADEIVDEVVDEDVHITIVLPREEDDDDDDIRDEADMYIDHLNSALARLAPQAWGCRYPNHQNSWYAYSDGATMSCDICHPRPSCWGA